MPRRLVTSFERPGGGSKLVPLVLLALALWFPFWASSQWLIVGNLTLIAIVGAVGLMILSGFAGQVSLGHSAFLALGAFTMAIVGQRAQLPYWLILPGCGLIAAAFGLAVGGFALRLRGLYLAIVTIGLVFFVQHVLHAMPGLTGGGGGLPVPAYVWFGETAEEMDDIHVAMQYGPFILDYQQKFYFVFLLVAGLAVWSAGNLVRSQSGRAMMAVRDQDLAAASLGVHATRTKLAAFGTSSFMAGIAGGMFALQQQYVTIEPFHFAMSVEYIAMIVVGGAGTVAGAVLGAVALTALSPLVQMLGPHLPYLSRLSTGQQRTVVFSFLVCLMLVVEPRGLAGIVYRVRRFLATWPFRS